MQKHTDSLNAAVQHLPAAPTWGISSAVRKAGKQLVLLLQGAGAAAGDAAVPEGHLGSSDGVAAVAAADATGEAAAAGGAASAGIPLMVNGVLVGKAGGSGVAQANGAAGQKKRKDRNKKDREFRERLIKKFSAKTQVRQVFRFAFFPCILGPLWTLLSEAR